MIKLNRRFKYIAIAAVIMMLAAVGTYIENHEGDAFVVETHTVSDDIFIPNAESRINDKININAASVDELTELSGIGETIAQRIVDFRTENGPFLTVESIMLVGGIGEKMFEDIADLICIE